MKSLLLDRRAFLGGAGLTVVAVVATSSIPLSIVHALPGRVALSAESVAEGLGHVDDVCGHWPPYSHPIGRVHIAPVITAHVAPIDSILLI